MEAVIKGKKHELTEEELEFVKRIYGYWEESGGVYIFNVDQMIPIRELVKILGVSRQAIHYRHRYNPEKYPLHRFGEGSFIYEHELEVWKQGTRLPKNKLLNN